MQSKATSKACTHDTLRRLMRRLSQHYDGRLKPSGLKTTQYSLLSHVTRLGPIRPGELAAVMEMEPSTLTRNLQSLIANGWVVVGAGADGRSRSVEATGAGRAKRSEAQREWKRAQLALNERLGPQRVARLHAVIDECLALMNDSEGSDDE